MEIVRQDGLGQATRGVGVEVWVLEGFVIECVFAASHVTWESADRQLRWRSSDRMALAMDKTSLLAFAMDNNSLLLAFAMDNAAFQAFALDNTSLLLAFATVKTSLAFASVNTSASAPALSWPFLS